MSGSVIEKALCFEIYQFRRFGKSQIKKRYKIFNDKSIKNLEDVLKCTNLNGLFNVKLNNVMKFLKKFMYIYVLKTHNKNYW